MLVMSAILEYPQKHPISAEEYLRMGEAGVFAPEARLELIEGEILEMAPIGPPHAGLVARLNRLFVQRVGASAVVWGQSSVVISDRSVPQPDLALLKYRTDDYMGSLPRASDVFLAVEVSDTTLPFDLRTKAPLYARCGIAELWIVDVNEKALHVFRGPAKGGYRTMFVAKVGEGVACVALPQVVIEVGELFSA
jgi:Uma2 family endonuclease